MTEYQLNADGHRGTKAVKRLVEYAPASGGLALWMQHRNVDQPPSHANWAFGSTDKRSWIIANDGTTIYYGKAFENLTLTVQTGLVAHQILHVALRHVAREKALRERLGSVDPELFGVCADAIVNSSLSHLQWLELPTGSITLDKVLLHVMGIDEPVDLSLHQWSTETLYRAIDDRNWQGSSEQTRSSARSSDSVSGKEQIDSGSGSTISGHSADQPAQSMVEHSAKAYQQEQRDGPRSEAARQLAATMIRDLLTNPDDSPEDQAEQTRQWSERLLRAHTSDAEQSLMRQLLADNKTLKTPWEQLLRTRLQRALSQKLDISWSRPTRSWLANQGRTRFGKRLPWQPGLSSTKNSPRLCVMVDVSGSVDDLLMHRFANEIDRMMRTMRTDTYLIIGDDKVTQQHTLKVGVETLRNIEFNGGGGTDFAPLIKAADKLQPDIGIFLTDLDGPAGEAPRWPLLWAIPESARARKEPFGQLLVLE